MAAKDNVTARVFALVAEHGGWIDVHDVVRMTGLNKPSAGSAIQQIIIKAPQWCGPDGIDTRMVKRSSGGHRRQIRVRKVINMPDANARSAAEIVRQALAENPELTVRELARIANCHPSTAYGARKEFRQYGPGGKPAKVPARTPADEGVIGALALDERLGWAANRLMRELWPRPAA